LAEHQDYRPLLLHWGDGVPGLAEFTSTIIGGFTHGPRESTFTPTTHVVRQRIGAARWLTHLDIDEHGEQDALRFAQSFASPLRTTTGRVFRAIPAILDIPMIRATATNRQRSLDDYQMMLQADRGIFFHVYEDLDGPSQEVARSLFADVVQRGCSVTFWIGGDDAQPLRLPAGQKWR
jgi:hypothetical protein